MGETSFKEKFKRLLKDAEELVKKTPDEELEKIKINVLKAEKIPNSNVLCTSEEEFVQKMLERVTGVAGQYAYILPQHDQLPEERIAEHRAFAEKNKRLFILPSIVYPESRGPLDDYPTPYILFFTHDKKLFMFPYEGEAFSDVEFEIEDDEDDDLIEFEPDF